MVQAGTENQATRSPHELSDLQADFLKAKRELLAARRQIAAAAAAMWRKASRELRGFRRGSAVLT
jgi:hypothetical protein